MASQEWDVITPDFYEAHGYSYAGPTYEAELASLRQALTLAGSLVVERKEDANHKTARDS